MTKKWTPDEIALAQQLKNDGLKSREIGCRFGVSGAAIRALLAPSHTNRCRAKQPYYMSDFFNGPPIGRCQERERLVKNAIEGSAQLKAAIEAALSVEKAIAA